MLAGPSEISAISAPPNKNTAVKQPMAVRSKSMRSCIDAGNLSGNIDLAKQTMAADPPAQDQHLPQTKTRFISAIRFAVGRNAEVAMLSREGWNTADSPVFVQSFDPAAEIDAQTGSETKAVN